VNPAAFYTALYKGSCAPELRKTVWKTLLGQYPLSFSDDERSTRDAEVKLAFEARQKELAPLVAALPERYTGNEESLSFESQCEIIDLDVTRSEFLKDETGVYNDKLRAVLRTYVYENSDTGYVQGMSDLLEPITVVLEDAPSAHYCFTRLLRHAGPRFDNLAENGIQSSLRRLRCLLAYLDPDLSEYFQSQEFDHMYFAYRWFLLDFKREFEPAIVLEVWEATWAARHVATQHFAVFIAIAIFQINRDALFKCKGFSDILKLLNDLSMDPKTTISRARELVDEVRGFASSTYTR